MEAIKVGDAALIRVKITEVADTEKGKIYRAKIITETNSQYYAIELMPKDIVE